MAISCRKGIQLNIKVFYVSPPPHPQIHISLLSCHDGISIQPSYPDEELSLVLSDTFPSLISIEPVFKKYISKISPFPPVPLPVSWCSQAALQPSTHLVPYK